ncbi:hypothetical protein SLA2020_141640 [Shorea laevis]
MTLIYVNLSFLQYPEKAVYGLTEISREEVKNARLVANPGCYPTSIQLPLVPLIKAKLIEYRNIIIDSKSGVSGAGRGAKEANLYSEIAEGIYTRMVLQGIAMFQKLNKDFLGLHIQK